MRPSDREVRWRRGEDGVVTAAVSLPQHRARWSAARDCPRKAVYGAVGAPAREWTENEEWVLASGRMWGRAYADWLEQKHGVENVQRERPVVMPIGVGHCDVYLRPTRTMIEVVSSSAPAGLIDGKALQLCGYMHYDPEAADLGLVVVIDPRNPGDRDEIPVRLTDEMREEVEARVWQVKHGLEGGTMPPRVCKKPSDARGHWCPFAETCFDGWEPEPLHELNDPVVMDLAAAWIAHKAKEREAKQRADEAEADRKDVEAQLAAAGVEEGGHVAGAFTLERTIVRRQPTIDGKKLKLAGFPLPDEFYKPGPVYSTWTVKQRETATATAAATEDFGDEAPF
jgi:CRISPR/Cas system-associated exonuclease Cas4 (RecB family)